MKKLTVSFSLLLFAVAMVGAQPVTLNVFYNFDATSAGYASEKAIWDKFQKDNPDIELKQEVLFNEPFHQKMAAYVVSGNMPDVMYMWPSGRSSEIQKRHLTKDLTKVLGADFMKSFVPVATDGTLQMAGYVAELPRSITYTTVVYANVALLKANGLSIPKTYADLKAMVPKLKAKGIATLLMANKDTWVMQSCLFSSIAGRMLGDSFFDQVLQGKAKFTDPGFINALTIVQNLYKDGILSPDTIQIGYGESPALFASGKAAFMIDGDWRQSDFLTDKSSGKALIDPAKQKSDFQYIQLPVLPGEKNPGASSAILGVGYGINAAIPAGSPKEKAAIRLIKYLYSAEVMKANLESGNFIPTLKGITSDKLEPFTANMPLYYQSIPKITYVLDGIFDASVVDPLNNGLQSIGLGLKTPAQVAKETQEAMDAFLAKQKK